ncbi:WXG100 family type VII secretion target [Amycolatopsis thailandensis]|uniref:WXG100 family type VII secretion target n=1 Tax=Amycolatopsis thailandensis TaxID=589330 RepID=UPI00363B365F
MTSSEPPPAVDPELDGLTFEQLAQLINEVSPEVFYHSAQAFDAALRSLEQISDDLERETRNLWEGWQGRGADSFDDLVRQVSGLNATVIQAVATPGYGAVVRRAGDALTLAQQRIRDLEAQNRKGDVAAARQIIHELGVAYQDVGRSVVPLPGTASENPVIGSVVLTPAGPTGAGSHVPLAGGHGAPFTGRNDSGRRARNGLAGESSKAPTSSTAFTPAVRAVREQTQPVLTAANVDVELPVPAVLGRELTPVVDSPVEEAGEAGQGTPAAVLGRPARTAQSGKMRTAEPKPKPKRTVAEEVAPQAQPVPITAGDGVPSTTAEPRARAETNTQPSQVATTGEPEKIEKVTVASAAVSPAAATATTSAQVTSPLVAPPDPGSATLGRVPAPPAIPIHSEVPRIAAQHPFTASPPSPTVQAVFGSLDASVGPGAPPPVVGTVGSSRFPGETGQAGGFMGPMARGAEAGNDPNEERHPRGLLAEPEVWDPADGTPAALGRPTPVRKFTEDVEDQDLIRSVLGRFDQREES